MNYEYRDSDFQNLANWARCDLSTQHFSADKRTKTLTLKPGSMSDSYGWSYNNWCENSLCSEFPPSTQLNKRAQKVINLLNAFQKTVIALLPEVDEQRLKNLQTVKAALIKHVNTSHLGLKFANCAKPLEVMDYNNSIKHLEKWLDRRAKSEFKTARQVIQIRKELTGMGVDETSISKITLAYCLRLRKEITSTEFQRNLKELEDPTMTPLSPYLSELFLECESQIPPYDWGCLIPPKNPQVTQDMQDWLILQKRLESCFPSRSSFRKWAYAQKKTEVQQMPIPDFPRQDLIETCDDLMEISCRIMQAIYDEVQAIGKEKNLSQFEMAKLVTEQTGLKPKKGVTPYFSLAFFKLPLAYRTIVNLAQKEEENQLFSNPNLSLLSNNWRSSFHQIGTIQHRWQQNYHDKTKQLIQLVGKENLEKADHTERYTIWTSEHFINEPFPGFPTTLPT